MMKISLRAVTVFSLMLTPVSAFAQGEISDILFDSVPEGARFVSGQQIGLEADTAVAGNLDVTGEVTLGVGIRFPDGSLQTTAGGAAAGASANAGLYSNTIPDFAPPLAYTEICIKNGDTSFDIHGSGESTAGGNCLPGDTGWIIERFERDAGAVFSWSAARLECLEDGMRLPEPFEWQLACERNAEFAISDIDDDWEWSGNAVAMIRIDITPTRAAVNAFLMGSGSCAHGTHGTIARNDGATTTAELRCAR